LDSITKASGIPDNKKDDDDPMKRQAEISKTELRRQRLRALGQPQSSPNEDVVDKTDITSITRNASIAAASAVPDSQENVIDLLDDSSSSSSSAVSLDVDDMHDRKPAAQENAVHLLNDDSDNDDSLMKGRDRKQLARKVVQKAKKDPQSKPRAQAAAGNMENDPDPVIDVDIAEVPKESSHGKQRKRQNKVPKLSSSFSPTTKSDFSSEEKSAKKMLIPSTVKGTTHKKSRRNDSVENASLIDCRFQAATYNVWFGPNGDGTPHPEARMKYLAKVLYDSHEPVTNPLLFIGFQEVVGELFDPLHLRFQDQYNMVLQKTESYGCAIAVHKSMKILDMGWVDYPNTVMGRGFLYARTAHAHFEKEYGLLFTTTHLESWTGEHYTGATQRTPQLQFMEQFCNNQFRNHPDLQLAIMSGDMNWDDERTARSRTGGLDPVMSTILDSSDWVDVWLANRSDPKTQCYTYDAKVNRMLGGSLRRRFDRILVRSRYPYYYISKTDLLGTEVIPQITWQKYNLFKKTNTTTPLLPSDHFGFVVHIVLTYTP
jgi:hypothetical protein